MKISRRWRIALVVWVLLLALGAIIARAIWQRQAAADAQARSAAAGKAVMVLDLTEGDIVAARVGELTRVVDVSGTVRAQHSAWVKAKQSGEIIRLTVREGDAVKADQVLVEQDTAEAELRIQQADQQVASARAQLEIARRSLSNNKSLVAQGFISPTALETSASTEMSALAQVTAAQAALDLARKARADLTLRAPIAGMVAQRTAQPGERVGIDTRLLEIIDLSSLEVEAPMSPQDVAELRVGRQVAFRVDGLSQPVTARVARISPAAQPGSRAISVFLSLSANPGLRQGLFASAAMPLQSRQVLWVPETAIRQDRPRPYVWLLQGQQIAERSVVLGQRGQVQGQDAWEVTQGLQSGERLLAGRVGGVSEGTAWRLSAAASKNGASAASR